jgi:hypothetical protein
MFCFPVMKLGSTGLPAYCMKRISNGAVARSFGCVISDHVRTSLKIRHSRQHIYHSNWIMGPIRGAEERFWHVPPAYWHISHTARRGFLIVLNRGKACCGEQTWFWRCWLSFARFQSGLYSHLIHVKVHPFGLPFYPEEGDSSFLPDFNNNNNNNNIISNLI